MTELKFRSFLTIFFYKYPHSGPTNSLFFLEVSPQYTDMYGIRNINTVITFGKCLFFNIILYPLKMTIHEQQYLLFNIRLGGVRLRLGLMGKLDCAWVYGWWLGGVIYSIPSINVNSSKHCCIKSPMHPYPATTHAPPPMYGPSFPSTPIQPHPTKQC